MCRVAHRVSTQKKMWKYQQADKGIENVMAMVTKFFICYYMRQILFKLFSYVQFIFSVILMLKCFHLFFYSSMVHSLDLLSFNSISIVLISTPNSPALLFKYCMSGSLRIQTDIVIVPTMAKAIICPLGSATICNKQFTIDPTKYKNKADMPEFEIIFLLQQMKWRNQNKNINRNRNNQTLDSFIAGLTPQSDSSNSSSRKSNIIPKIKVPHSSGLSSIYQPLSLPFLYPQYPQFRQYQYTISIKCVTENTLVCLPTGLGKTHIASVMILNFHQWFPEGLIFFLAPTKPLVDQQTFSLSNFKHYVAPNKIFSLTGSIPVPKRRKIYLEKRIFFCTPQTLENDLRDKRLNPKSIVLIIFDEAHRAVGNYSYAKIVRMLDTERFGYRIIGLSATPGNDHAKIQQVIENLQISIMLVKNDQDKDVAKYIKTKKIQPIFIQATTIIRQIDGILNQYISWPLNQLLKFKLFDRNLAGGKYGFNAKCFYLINQQINQRLASLPVKFVFMAQSAKCFLKFLADSQLVLRDAGYQSFKRKFVYQIQGIQGQADEKVKIHDNFVQIVRQHPGFKRIKQLLDNNSNAKTHPKLQKLRQLLLKFLSSKQSKQKNSKVIIFANFRYTCHQIHKYMSQHPYNETIKSQIFLGQSKTTVQTRDGENSTTQTLYLSQKEQINMIKRYKNNEINTLISTSIGEEGLDIGEVDAIFCYEGGMSTIRMVQRMGRTGRKRDGVVYVLLMQGKESEDFEKANKKTQKMKKTNAQKYKYYSYNPVLFEDCSEIPINFFSKPIEEYKQEIKQEQTKKKKIKQKGNAKQTKKKKEKKEKGEKLKQIRQQSERSQQSRCSQLQQNRPQLNQQQQLNQPSQSNISNISKSKREEYINKFGMSSKIKSSKLIQIKNNTKSKLQYDLSSEGDDQQEQYDQNYVVQEQETNEKMSKLNVNELYQYSEEEQFSVDSNSYSNSISDYCCYDQFDGKIERNQQFDKLFQLDKLLGDNTQSQQDEQNKKEPTEQTIIQKPNNQTDRKQKITCDNIMQGKYNKLKHEQEQEQEQKQEQKQKQQRNECNNKNNIKDDKQCEIAQNKEQQISLKSKSHDFDEVYSDGNAARNRQQFKQVNIQQGHRCCKQGQDNGQIGSNKVLQYDDKDEQSSDQDSIGQIFKQYNKIRSIKQAQFTTSNMCNNEDNVDLSCNIDTVSQNSSDIIDRQEEIQKEKQITHITASL